MAKFKKGDLVEVCWLAEPEWEVQAVLGREENQPQRYRVTSPNDINAGSVNELGMKLIAPVAATKKTHSILHNAEALIHGDRAKAYGNPFDNNERIARLWSVIAGAPISAHHVPLMMIALKLSQQTFNPKRDNLIAIAGYAETAQMMVDTITERLHLPANGGSAE